jgi:hypothetical protein
VIKDIITTASIGIILVLAGCKQANEVTNPESTDRDLLYKANRINAYNNQVLPQLQKMVHTGDVITRCGIDLTSQMLRRLNQQDNSFSHIGIASIELDTTFVYHAIGGEFNPNQKLRREPLYSFLHPTDNNAAGLYSIALNTKQQLQLITEVQCIYKAGIPFDLDFDWDTNNKLYCAEFVIKSFQKVLNDTNYFHRTTIMGKQGVAVDDFTTNKNVKALGVWKYE